MAIGCLTKSVPSSTPEKCSFLATNTTSGPRINAQQMDMPSASQLYVDGGISRNARPRRPAMGPLAKEPRVSSTGRHQTKQKNARAHGRRTTRTIESRQSNRRGRGRGGGGKKKKKWRCSTTEWLAAAAFLCRVARGRRECYTGNFTDESARPCIDRHRNADDGSELRKKAQSKKKIKRQRGKEPKQAARKREVRGSPPGRH